MLKIASFIGAGLKKIKDLAKSFIFLTPSSKG